MATITDPKQLLEIVQQPVCFVHPILKLYARTTLLSEACRYAPNGDLSMIKLLLDCKSDINWTSLDMSNYTHDEHLWLHHY